jgi:hypothetical protein
MKKLTFLFLFTAISLMNISCNSGSKVEFVEKENQIDVLYEGQLITSYLHGADLLKPCLFPVNSPSGETLTRAYPFKEIEGESNDHPHHTGAYFTYASNGEVNGDSFWNLHPVPPQIKHIKVLEKEQEKNEGEITTLSHWISSENKTILEEKREMEFTVSENKYTIDFKIELTATDETVTFEDTKEGMFAIRVADWLAENAKSTLYKSTGEYLNAEGEKTEKNIWGKQSSWVRLEGEKDGKTIGITIFHHPESVNYPTFWHARGYGCFAANPIGQFDFQKGRGEENPVKRSLKIEPGKTALFKFRMTVYEGESSKEQFDQEFEDFSKD